MIKKMKKIMSLMLVCAMIVMSFVPMRASAAVNNTRPTTEWCEQYGWTRETGKWTKTQNGINYELTLRTLRNGDTSPSYMVSVTKSQDASGKLIIPGELDGYPVVQIYDNAFWGADITECTIGEGVILIGDSSFRECNKLTKITLPNTFEEIIGGNTFESCDVLETITFPASTINIGGLTFKDCEKLKSVTFEGNAPKASTTMECFPDDVIINIQEGTAGWNVEPWTKLNINVVTDANSKVESISLDETEISTWIGNETAVKATLTPNVSGATITWTSSNESVATVKDGVITGVSVGDAIVTARCGTAFATVNVSVREYEIEPEKFVFYIDDVEYDARNGIHKMELGKTIKLSCKVEPNGVEYPISYKICEYDNTNESLVKYENEIFEPFQKGMFEILFTCGNIQRYMYIDVVEKIEEEPTPQPTPTVTQTPEPTPVADWTELNKAIERAEALDLANLKFPEGFRGNFEGCLNFAKNMELEASQEVVDEVAGDLNMFIDELLAYNTPTESPTPSVTEEPTVTEQPTPSVTPEVTDTPDPTPSIPVPTETEEPKPEVTPVIVNKSRLESLVNGATTDKDTYTEESWSVFEAAVEAGKAVLADENATQEEVDNARVLLNEAIEALVPIVEPTETPEVTKSVTEIFSDVHKDWYTEYVQYVYDNGLMTGLSGTTKFAPNANITKAQVAQVLYNMEGKPEVKDQKVFKELKDVYTSEWYANAVAWAYNTGVVTGDTNAMKFFPNADVTREQLALMMYRYADYKKYDVTASSDLAGLKNAEKTADWALAGVKWAVGSGLISGVEKNGVKDLQPQGNASRAQMAAILQRFCKK